jgi:predicted SprT family Zn-dependent metalloprotease
VQIIWSKTLRTTAGMAKWKVEKLRLPDGHVAMGGHELADRVRHHATIELSVKVVDNEEKLYNVLCHEWCHLANYMISDVRKPPHGESFKKWAAQCTHAFSHLGVKVTTTHSYEIECKYQWTCQNLQCKYIYMRHSQSIDPEKHSCGACTSGRLLQTQPVPKVKRPITGYQAFMKENFSRIKAENPGKPQKELMGLVGKEYREAKAKDEDAKKGSGFVEAGEKEGVLEELLWGLEV